MVSGARTTGCTTKVLELRPVPAPLPPWPQARADKDGEDPEDGVAAGLGGRWPGGPGWPARAHLHHVGESLAKALPEDGAATSNAGRLRYPANKP